MSLDVAALYAAHDPTVRRYVRRRLLGVDDAVIEDVIADVWERVVRAAPRYRDRGLPIAAWLRAIARNLLADYYRHRGLIDIVRLGDLKPYGEHVGTNEHVDRMDTRRALATLSERQRLVIVGRYYEGRKHCEMAHITTLNGSKKLQDRAFVNLRKVLEVA